MIGALLLPAGIAANAALAYAPGLVERLYARRAYPVLAGALTATSSPLPFAVVEILGAALLGSLAFAAFRLAERLRRAGRACTELKRTASALLAGAGAAYALFLVLWGFNYRRPPLAELSGLEAHPATPSELRELTRALVENANTLRDDLPESGAGVFRLEGGLDAVLVRAPLGLRRAARAYPALAPVEARPKAALLSPLLSRVGISGIYIPFTGEPILNATLPESELPFSASHELAHARGIAREDEANFIASVACRLHPDGAFRYSGALAASSYAAAALSRLDPPGADRLLSLRSPGVRRDVAEIQAWVARYAGPLVDAGERVNDAYLKTQGQAEGVRSYGRMVDLLIAERRAGLRSPP